MTLQEDGWFDWAIRDPGPANRILSPLKTSLDVYVCHSMEGVYNYPDGFIVLRDPAYFPTAWHWTKKRDGRLCQHYSAFAHLQHGHAANVLGPGGEAEGFSDEPLTIPQLATDLRVIRDINEFRVRHGLSPLKRKSGQPQGKARGLVEHREMAPQFNTTQCPSERYASLWKVLAKEGEAMTPAELKRMEDLEAKIARLERILAANGIDTDGDGVVDKVGEEALLWADDKARQWSAFFGLALARKDIAALQQIAFEAGVTPEFVFELIQKSGYALEQAGQKMRMLTHGQ